MKSNFLKTIFSYAKVSQRTLSVILRISQSTISNILNRSIHYIPVKYVEIICLLIDLDINSLTGVHDDFVILNDILILKTIKRYNLDEQLVFECRQKIKTGVKDLNLYNNSERNKKFKNDQRI